MHRFVGNEEHQCSPFAASFRTTFISVKIARSVKVTKEYTPRSLKQPTVQQGQFGVAD